MVDSIFSTIGDAIEGMSTAVGSSVSEITKIFWDSTANTGAGAFTTLGILTLVGLGAGLVFFALRLIIRTVRGVA